ncbi:MAG TPA: tetratricopeptide repeat protein [Spirochaetota bacterium]|nr:tetratricopeptide repeat protein [Spirochaetota bacterium]HPJ34062.1 tetratricopeptide repeat protein [Spirochaetota bacterium]
MVNSNFKRAVYVTVILSLFLFSGYFLSEAQNAVSLNKEGWNYYSRTEYDRALFSFLGSIRMNPGYSDSILGAGKTYYQMGVYDKALDMYLRVLKLDSRSVDALNGIGMVFSETGRFSKAISYFEKAFAISGSAIESRYGLAYVYYRMDRKVWARRKLENIFKSNPYHFESLLLMADIKAEEGRLGEAREYIEKAIDSNSQSPVGYARYGRVLFKNYIVENNSDSLVEAKESYAKALSINPDNYNANFDMGLMAIYELYDILFEKTLSGDTADAEFRQKSDSAEVYINRAIKINRNRNAMYALALSHELGGDRGGALDTMLDIYSKYPSDAVLRGKLEDFLILNEYKAAHPARVMLSAENIELSRSAGREALHNRVIYYLRRAMLMNPLNREVRERLIDYYSILDYNILMIDEMKSLLRQYPEFKYQEMLNIAVMKRRDRLYYREGYSNSEIPRDVPVVLVMNFDTGGKISSHPDAGRIVAGSVTFALQQYGRMKVAGPGDRNRVAGYLKINGENLFRSFKRIQKVFEDENREVRFAVYGDITEVDDYLNVTCRIMDMERGFVIGEFSESVKGKENLTVLSMNIADKLFEMIPYNGRVIKVDDKGIIVNLGLIDGIKSGSRLVIYRDSRSRSTNDLMRKGELLTVRETDTYMSYAEPDSVELLNEIDSTDNVYPLKNRRARKIE